MNKNKITKEYREFYENRDSHFYNKQMKSFNPLRKWFQVNRYRIINNLVKSKFTKGAAILDLGCGSCNWNVDGLKVVGVDLNEGLLKLAKAQNRLSDYKVAELGDAGFNRGLFDIVVASEVLEHSYDYDGTIREINRILRPGGYAIISVPFDTYSGLWKYLFFVQCMFQGYVLGDNYYRKKCGHINKFSLSTLKAAFLKQDFNVEDIFDMRRFTIFLVAQKSGTLEETHSYDDLTVVLPTLNEGPNIKDLLGQLSLSYKNAQIIVADDGSNDQTKEIVLGIEDKTVLFLDRKNADIHGLTASVLDAIRLVETKYFIVMDADGQHPWQKVKDLVNYLRLGDKLVIASRIKVSGKWPLQRKAISYLGTAFGKLSLLFRGKFYLSYDILTGFFGAETNFWKEVAFNNGNAVKFRLRGYKILFDFFKILPRESQISEVYYAFNERKKASSKITLKVYLEYIKSFI